MPAKHTFNIQAISRSSERGSEDADDGIVTPFTTDSVVAVEWFIMDLLPQPKAAGEVNRCKPSVLGFESGSQRERLTWLRGQANSWLRLCHAQLGEIVGRLLQTIFACQHLCPHDLASLQHVQRPDLCAANIRAARIHLVAAQFQRSLIRGYRRESLVCGEGSDAAAEAEFKPSDAASGSSSVGMVSG